MAKNTKDIGDNLRSVRRKQADERRSEVDTTQQRNPDIASGTVEGLYSKGVAHDATTLVGDKFEIQKIQLAVESGSQADFDAINLAGTRKQASPQGSLSSELSGGDPEGITMDPPPALNSRQAAAEMAEVYLKNIMRDKPFIEYEDGSQEITEALAILNAFGNDFKGPKDTGMVTAKTLFRGNSARCLIGAYVSQLYLNTIGVGNFTYEPVGTRDDGVYGNTEANYLSIQNGNIPVQQMKDNTLRYMYNGRQLGSTVHIDLVFQHFYEAAAVLLNRTAPVANVVVGDQINVGPKEGNFLGGPVLTTTMIAEVSRHALRAAWVQKWRKHLRLRPEAMAGRVVAEEAGNLPVGTVHEDLFNLPTPMSSVVQKVKDFNADPMLGNGDNAAFLPLQYAEGSPTHPAYPAGHATIAGACATILKIMVSDGNWVSTTGLAEIQARADGLETVPYDDINDAGMTTIHGEIDKLAHNVALGRDFAGVHYRSDSELALGEKVAIQYYKDQKALFNEEVDTVEFVGFAGQTITV